eukprot:jgi/Mesvir1/12221/Mv00449-RA.1
MATNANEEQLITSSWFYGDEQSGGRPIGPVSFKMVQARWKQGSLGPTTLVWCDGAGWSKQMRIVDVPGLLSLLSGDGKQTTNASSQGKPSAAPVANGHSNETRRDGTESAKRRQDVADESKGPGSSRGSVAPAKEVTDPMHRAQPTSLPGSAASTPGVTSENPREPVSAQSGAKIGYTTPFTNVRGLLGSSGGLVDSKGSIQLRGEELTSMLDLISRLQEELQQKTEALVAAGAAMSELRSSNAALEKACTTKSDLESVISDLRDQISALARRGSAPASLSLPKRTPSANQRSALGAATAADGAKTGWGVGPGLRGGVAPAVKPRPSSLPKDTVGRLERKDVLLPRGVISTKATLVGQPGGNVAGGGGGGGGAAAATVAVPQHRIRTNPAWEPSYNDRVPGGGSGGVIAASTKASSVQLPADLDRLEAEAEQLHQRMSRPQSGSDWLASPNPAHHGGPGSVGLRASGSRAPGSLQSSGGGGLARDGSVSGAGLTRTASGRSEGREGVEGSRSVQAPSTLGRPMSATATGTTHPSNLGAGNPHAARPGSAVGVDASARANAHARHASPQRAAMPGAARGQQGGGENGAAHVTFGSPPTADVAGADGVAGDPAGGEDAGAAFWEAWFNPPSSVRTTAKGQQMATLVDSLVTVLLRRFMEEGIGLPLTKIGDCLYRLDQRKIQLHVLGGKLCVRAGGGYRDFLEYLSKTKISFVQVPKPTE